MADGLFGRILMRGGLSLAAAMMMTTAGLAQDQETPGGADPAVMTEAFPDTDDGQDVQVPDPDTQVIPSEPDIVIDDGWVIGGWPDEPVDDGSDGGWVDDGTDDWVDDGVDDGTDDWVDDGTDDWVDDGTDAGVDDGTDDWVDDSTDNWVDGGTDDGVADDGVVDDGVVDDGEVVIRYLDGGPVLCPDCEGLPADLAVEAYQMSAGNPLVESATAGSAEPPVQAKPRRSKSKAAVTGGMVDCLAEHPQLPWLCEWQNGAGQ